MKLKDIIIKDDFANSHPSEIGLELCREFYRRHGRIDKNIYVDSETNELLDGYIRYLVLKENNIEDAVVLRIPHDSLDSVQEHTDIAYIYGHHPNNTKVYVWKTKYTKFRDLNKYHIGARALVNTKHGAKEITVTRISLEKPLGKRKIKNLITCLDS